MNNYSVCDIARSQRHILSLSAALGLFGMIFGLSTLLHSGTGLKRTQRTVSVAGGTVTLAGEANRGFALFERNCAHCHGDDARGDEGPNLHNLVKSEARISSIIKEGIKGEMPAFGKKFNQVDIQALVSYLHTLVD